MTTALRPMPSIKSTIPTGVGGRAVSAPSSLPRTGVALIGTSRTVPALAALIAAGEGGSPVLAGWIDVDAATPGASRTPECAADWVVPRLGGLTDLPALIGRLGLKAAVVCVPASKKESISRVLAAAEGTRLDLRILPCIEDLLNGRAGEMDRGLSPGRSPAMNRLGSGSGQNPPTPHSTPSTTYITSPTIDLGELIGRTPYQLDREAVARVLTGKRVLITGAGGSIGSELARVAAAFAPEQLILMERAENALFEIDRQMARRFPDMARKAVLHDVVDAERTLRLLAELRPHVVFHAAAHKHVPLMEDHPGHAITNNLFGTKSIADASVAVGAERFVMISSDKAVNPTSVMGATKRLAELYVRGLGPRGAEHGARLSMVRFGNVLGSACSVLTIWSTQLAEGGPLTITDPRMTRYFMTIPEAATLVVQSTVVGGASAKDAVGVYVLDMGEPIRIVDLANRFVRSHGLWARFASSAAFDGLGQTAAIPDPLPPSPPPPPAGSPTIDVVFSGCRPGEKLHEELAYAAEALHPTGHPGVRTWAGPGFSDADVSRVQDMVTELGAARFNQDPSEVVRAIRRHVPEMRAAASTRK